MGTPNREPQEYSTNIIGIYLPGSSYSFIFLPYSSGSMFGVHIKVPLFIGFWAQVSGLLSRNLFLEIL